MTGLSGESGSGKTHCSMEALRLLLEAAGGGSQTDAFKYLSAALTVVRSMASALTAGNADSSRVASIGFDSFKGQIFRGKRKGR